MKIAVGFRSTGHGGFWRSICLLSFLGELLDGVYGCAVSLLALLLKHQYRQRTHLEWTCGLREAAGAAMSACDGAMPAPLGRGLGERSCTTRHRRTYLWRSVVRCEFSHPFVATFSVGRHCCLRCLEQFRGPGML